MKNNSNHYTEYVYRKTGLIALITSFGLSCQKNFLKLFVSFMLLSLCGFSFAQPSLGLLFDGVLVDTSFSSPSNRVEVEVGKPYTLSVVSFGYTGGPMFSPELLLIYNEWDPTEFGREIVNVTYMVDGADAWAWNWAGHYVNLVIPSSIPTGTLFEVEYIALEAHENCIELQEPFSGIVFGALYISAVHHGVTATNNWDGTVTVTWIAQGEVKLVRQEAGNPSNEVELPRDGSLLAVSSYEDVYEPLEFKKKYIYIVKDLSGTELVRTTQEVMPDIVVVLVRGYSLFGDGVNVDYWNSDDEEEDKGLVDVSAWFENSSRNITCWDASNLLNGRQSIKWNSDLLNIFISNQKTGDYENAKVNLIGHSMGGLISRRYAFDHHDEINNVICIQTPHTGTPLAELIGWFGGIAGYNLRPAYLKVFNHNYPPNVPMFFVYSNNWWQVLDDWKYKTAAAIIKVDDRFNLLFERSDGAVPLISGYGAIYRQQAGPADYLLEYDIDQNLISGMMQNDLDHGTGYRHPDTLNRVMEWLGYPPAGGASASAMQMQTMSEGEPEVVPLYFVAGFEGFFDSSNPVSETVSIGTSQKAYFSANVSDPDCIFTITNPGAVVIDPTIASTDPNITYHNEDGIQSYEVIDPLAGTWTLNLTTLLSDPNSVQYGLTAFEDQYVSFGVSSQKAWTNTGQSMLLIAQLLDNSGAITGAAVTADVELPDETVQNITLFDDGTNGDDTADDGIYSYAFTSTSLEGIYSIEAYATGTTSTASTFERGAAASFTATPADIAISGLVSDEGVDTNLNSYFDVLRFTVPVTVSVEKGYRLNASLVDSNSEMISLINSGVLPLATDAISISVDVDAQEIVEHNVAGPYTLRNIEISDASTGLTIADASDYVTAAYAVSAFEPLDSDGDGLSDVLEQSIGTDPNKIDTDADGATDYQEVSYDGDASSYNPPTDSNPLAQDTDSDGMTDGYEITCGLNPLIDDTAGDLDGDGLTNQQEYNLHTRPDKIDTDYDGRNDLWEIDNVTNPLVYGTYTRKAGDIDLDAVVGVSDLSIMAGQWLGVPGTPSADIAPNGGDGTVDLTDFAAFAKHWLESVPIALDAVSSYEGNTQVLSWSHDLGDGDDRVVVVTVGTEGGVAFTGVTFNGAAMTLAVDSTQVNSHNITAIYYILEADLPSAGSYTVEVSMATSNRVAAGAVSLRNVRQAPPEAVERASIGSGSTDYISGSITTLTDGAWIIDVVGSGDSTSFYTDTVDPPQVEFFDYNPGSSTVAGSTREVPTAGMVTNGWTTSDGNQRRRCLSMAAFAPVGTQ